MCGVVCGYLTRYGNISPPPEVPWALLLNPPPPRVPSCGHWCEVSPGSCLVWSAMQSLNGYFCA